MLTRVFAGGIAGVVAIAALYGANSKAKPVAATAPKVGIKTPGVQIPFAGVKAEASIPAPDKPAWLFIATPAPVAAAPADAAPAGGGGRGGGRGGRGGGRGAGGGGGARAGGGGLATRVPASKSPAAVWFPLSTACGSLPAAMARSSGSTPRR
jgi:hypothetical protein